MTWQPIDSAPRNRYVLISDGICLPDIVVWRGELPAKQERGFFRLARSAGWFCADLSRSRLDGKATIWAEIPPLPGESGTVGD